MIRRLLPLMILLLLSVSCTDDLNHHDVFATTSEQVMISFSVDKLVLSRADDQAIDESAIDHAYILFYPAEDSEFAGFPIAVVKAESPEAGKLRFNMPAALLENTAYQIIAVANADYYSPSDTDFMSYLETLSQTGVSSLSDMLLSFAESMNASKVTSLPMKGTLEGNSTFSFKKSGSVVYVNVALSFSRLVAGIDVSNLADNFVLEEVALCNWRDAVSLGGDGQLAGEIKGKLSSDENSGSSNVEFIKLEPGAKSLNGSLYCFPTASENPAPGDETTTAIIVKGSFNTGESSYYRVNLGISGNQSHLNPNTKYNVTITAVNGGGYPTAEEAYSATSEPMIVTAVVEDWNLEGNSFVVDNEGHVMVVSKTELEFDGDDLEPQEIKVLASSDLTVEASFIPSEGTPADAFSISTRSSNPVTILSISPAGQNKSAMPMSGFCHISAVKEGEEILSLQVALNQLSNIEQPYEPEIPEGLDFALIPLVGPERVKVDHDKKTIEIDGFDPGCFNSFIDVPFKVYVKDGCGYIANTVTTTLLWPLEGRVKKEETDKYYYCLNSLKTNSIIVFSDTSQSEISVSSGSVAVKTNDCIYISIGAMAPDDPFIERTVTLQVKKADAYQYQNFEYQLIVKPRTTIIDDVVLIDPNSNQSWLILDRNLQDMTQTYKDFVGRRSDNGEKRQAYNYSAIGQELVIPFKYSSSGTSFNESKHSLYSGKSIAYDVTGNYRMSIESEKSNWLAKYIYQNETFVRTSPFYESSNISGWDLPSQDVLELCRSKIRVSKMRMYLVSDVPAKIEGKQVNVCCYWPYQGNLSYSIDNANNRFGYYVTDADCPIGLIYNKPTEVLRYIPTTCNNYRGFMRLVRQLTEDELKDYKINYLGYGSTGCLLSPCHPDTYSSTSLGWSPN